MKNSALTSSLLLLFFFLFSSSCKPSSEEVPEPTLLGNWNLSTFSTERTLFSFGTSTSQCNDNQIGTLILGKGKNQIGAFWYSSHCFETNFWSFNWSVNDDASVMTLRRSDSLEEFEWDIKSLDEEEMVIKWVTELKTVKDLVVRHKTTLTFTR